MQQISPGCEGTSVHWQRGCDVVELLVLEDEFKLFFEFELRFISYTWLVPSVTLGKNATKLLPWA